MTTSETIDLVSRMVASGRPHYLATANVDFLVQALEDVELRRILFEAHLVLCDGTPLLWASRWLGNPLPERVAGSDLVPLLVRVAAERGYRLFFLGGSEEAAVQATHRLRAQYPSLVIAGHYSPPFKMLLDMDHDRIRSLIQAAKPDLLFVSFGCPKQEKWIAMHYRSLQVPVCIGVGGTIDFLAGRLARAPLWMQQTGTEWIFRLAQEPRRLLKRYLKDCWYFGGALAMQWCRTQFRSRRKPPLATIHRVQRKAAWDELDAPEWLDAEAVQHGAQDWERALAHDRDLVFRLSNVQFIDSTGVGLLIRLRKQLALQQRQLVLVGCSPAVERALHGMRLWPFFLTAPDLAQAQSILEELASAERASVKAGPAGSSPTLTWQGEVTAANAEEVWAATAAYLAAHAVAQGGVRIDLSQVTFIDSTGLGLMVRAKKQALNRDFELNFEGLQPNVRNVIQLSRLEAFLLGA